MKKIKIISLFLLITLLTASFVSCNGRQPNGDTGNATDTTLNTEGTTIGATTTETTEKMKETVVTEKVTDEITTEKPIEPDEPTHEISKSMLSDIMQNMFEGNTMKNETVMFIDYGDAKELMFYADSIISVTSYDGLTIYTEGVDYALVDGKLVLLEGSSIPCITSEVYYNNTSSDALNVEHDGKICSVYWGEGTKMTMWQVNVTYTHSDVWNGFAQPCYVDVYSEFLEKLYKGEDITVIFYGDSIARGANSSQYVNVEPYQPDFTKLFVYALADLFDYRVKHITTDLQGTFADDLLNYNSGDVRGTINYINSSVGGWGCVQALDNVQEYVVDVADFYGCDLIVLNFGENNSTTNAKTFQTYTKQTITKILEVVPDTALMLVSPMLSNPYDVYSGKNQILFEEPLEAMAESYVRAGTPCALVCMASLSSSILEHKTFNDYSANNINHPNDFFMRVYAQALLQALIGYENMN